MSGTFPERITGVLGSTEATLAEVARRCGVQVPADRLAEAVAVHRRGAEAVRLPRTGALDVLDALRERGFRLGLISDCSSELCEAWNSTPFAPRLDAAVFSWREGFRKPDQRLYSAAARRLGVTAQECWYVGDGGSREHQGALEAGMRPVHVTNAAYPRAAAFRDDPDLMIPDHAIDDIDQLLSLVALAEAASA